MISTTEPAQKLTSTSGAGGPFQRRESRRKRLVSAPVRPRSATVVSTSVDDPSSWPRHSRSVHFTGSQVVCLAPARGRRPNLQVSGLRCAEPGQAATSGGLAGRLPAGLRPHLPDQSPLLPAGRPAGARSRPGPSSPSWRRGDGPGRQVWACPAIDAGDGSRPRHVNWRSDQEVGLPLQVAGIAGGHFAGTAGTGVWL